MRHLKNGDSEPSINPKKYTLFGFRFCPFTDRVKLVLNYHKIDYDLVLISLIDKPDWLTNYSPGGKVPLLLNQGEKLMESDLIMRFVDELRGEPASLLSVCGEDLFNQAVELSSQFFKPVHRIIFGPDYDESIVNSFKQACDVLEKSIKSQYFAGDQLSLADLALFPLLDRFEVAWAVLQNSSNSLSNVVEFNMKECEQNQWPILLTYLNRMRQLSFIAELRETTHIQAKYAESKRSGNPDPEIH